MFHYRLAPSNNRSRMLVAVLLAIALHMGLMNFEFSPKPVLVPSVSLPHSVSIFLQQKSFVQTPEQPVNNIQDINKIKTDEIQAEKEPEAPVLENPPAIIEKQDNSIPPEPLWNKTVYEPTEIAEEKSKTSIDEV